MSSTYLCLNDCLTSDQKKTLLSLVDSDLSEGLREMCRNTQAPSDDLRETNIEILQNFKQNVIARQQKLKTKEKKTVLNILSCLKTRDAVGIRATVQRIEQLLTSTFALPEEESEVSFFQILI